MKKCNNCGHEAEDELKFCPECGSKLEEPAAATPTEWTCPNCGNVNPSSMKFCGECGTKFKPVEVPTEWTCPTCGNVNPPEMKFCGECGTKKGGSAPTSTPFDEPPAGKAKNNAAAPAARKGLPGPIGAVTNKVLSFEDKHHLITNVLIAVLALVIALVALFTPVRVMTYAAGFNDGYMAVDKEAEDPTEDYTKMHFVEVKMSLFDLMGTISYIAADPSESEDDAEKLQELAENFSDARIYFTEAWAEWLDDHSDLDFEDEKDMKKAMKAYEKLFTKHMKGFNFIAYVMLSNKPVYFDGELVGGNESLYANTLITAAWGLIAGLIAISVAITALFFLIFAIVRLVKKEAPKNFYKLFGVTLALGGVGLIMLALAPLTKASGGLFAVTLLSAISYIAFGALSGIFTGRESWLVILKRSIVAIVALIAFYILCGNVMNYKELTLKLDSDDMLYATSTAVPFGFALFMAIGCMFGPSESTVNQFNQMFRSPGLILSGIAIFIFATLMLAFVYTAMHRSVSNVALGAKEKASYGGFMITGIIFAIILTAVSGIATPLLFALLDNPLEAAIFSFIRSYSMRAQIIVSAVLLLAAFIFSKVFKPENKAAKA